MAEFNETKTPDMHDTWDGPGLPPAVKKVFVAMIAGLAVVAIPYLVTAALPKSEVRDEIAEFRVWTEDNIIPFSKHFSTVGTGPKTAVAGNEGGGASILEDAASDVGAEVDKLVTAIEITPPPVEVVEPVEAPDPTHPIEVKPPPKPVSPYLAIKIPEAAYKDITVFIEDPHKSLDGFYQALGDVALKKPGATVHLSHWGDSAIAADGMPSAVRRLLQRTFGDGGHGYSMVSASTPWYRRKDIEWTSKNWRTEEFIRDQAADGHYGYGGVVSEGSPGAKASWKTVEEGVGTAASRFTIYFQKHKRGGTLQVNIDGVEAKSIETATEGDLEEHSETIKVPDGPHTFEIRNSGGGRLRVYGVAVERSEGVVYDGMGVVGARDTRWLNANAEGMAWALKARDPDLYILMYGGNALEDKTTMSWYRERLVEVIKLWRTAIPGKSCLIMSPIDHGERYRGKVRTVERQVEMMAVQREVALQEGCAFFSIYDAMGGQGAIGRWFDEGLASGDLAHPTAKGSVELGRLFYQAIMKGLHDWVATQKDAQP